MNPRPSSVDRLLLDLLNDQPEPAEQAPLSLQRLRDALTTGPALSAAEQGVLYRSPLSRADYLRLKRELNAALQTSWRSRGLQLQLAAKAAADDSVDTQRYQHTNAGFQVTLYRQDDIDMPWMVLLQLDSAVHETIYPASTLILADSGGLEWARGRPDSRGELSFGWLRPEIDPRERLHAHTLILRLG